MARLMRDPRLWGAVAVLIPLAIIPHFVSSYVTFVLGLTLVYAIAAIGLTMLTGQAGQIGLAHAGFYTLGAYTAALLMAKLGLPFWPALVVAALGTAAVGFVLGFPALRLTGFYLAIATLGFAVLIERASRQWSSFTGGSQGMNIPPVTLFGTPLGQAGVYYVILAMTVVMTVAAINILRSRIGRAFIALRDSEVAAAAVGVNVSFYKMLAFALSAFYAGVGGALHGQLLGFVSPDQFTVWLMIIFLAMTVVGGLGSIVGAFIGSAFFTLAPEVLQGLQYWQRFVFGAIIMLTIAFLPGGVVSIPSRIREARTDRARSSTTPADGPVRPADDPAVSGT